MNYALRALAAFPLLCSAWSVGATNTEGLPDPFFGTGGYRLIDFPLQPSHDDVLFAVAVMSDQRIVSAGTVNLTPPNMPTSNGIGVARSLADSAPDPSFGGGSGRLSVPGTLYAPDGAFGGYAMAVQADGKIIVAGTVTGGSTQANDFLVVRVLANGAGLDPSFGNNGLVIVPFDYGGAKIDVARSVVIQSDGKIVAAGTVHRSPTDTDMAVVRLLSNGSLDTSFDGDGKRTVWFDLGGASASNYDITNGVALQSDGKIVLTGSATTASSGSDFVAARLLPNGSLDSSFGNLAPGKSRVGFVAGRDDQANAIAVSQAALDPNPSGRRIILAGEADTAAGDTDFAVVVLKDDGQLDTGFSSDGKHMLAFNLSNLGIDRALAVVVQTGWRKVGSILFPYRQIVLGGSAYTDTFTPHFESALARLNFDGSLDSNFGVQGKSHFAWYIENDPQPSNAEIVSMARQGNQLVVGGTTRVPRVGGPPDTDFVLSRVLLDD